MTKSSTLNRSTKTNSKKTNSKTILKTIYHDVWGIRGQRNELSAGRRKSADSLGQKVNKRRRIVTRPRGQTEHRSHIDRFDCELWVRTTIAVGTQPLDQEPVILDC